MVRKSKVKKHNSSKKQKQKQKKQNKSKKKNVCLNGLKPIKINNEVICVGRCPHSGGEIFYKPKIKKLECKLHQALFHPSGKYISGPPMGENLFVKKAKA